MKVFLFVLLATVLEATGDTLIRMALHGTALWPRIGLYVVGGLLLVLYGTSLNLAPVEFATVTGMYVATLYVVFQITNYLFFHVAPSAAVLVGGSFIVVGGAIISIWK